MSKKQKRAKWYSEITDAEWDDRILTMRAEIAEDLQVWEQWMRDNMSARWEDNFGDTEDEE